MQITAYNPQKGRLETVDVECTEMNTTWFDDSSDINVAAAITDVSSGLLIKKADHSYPLWIGGLSRAAIRNSRKKATQLLQNYE